jgi:CIC family chloride channel protein
MSSRWIDGLSDLRTRVYQSDSVILTVLALGIGVLTGLGATIFHLLLEYTDDLWQAATATLGVSQISWLIILFPVVGTLAALGFIWLLARDDRSHGTSAVIESVALHGGRLPAKALLTKVFAAAVFIGSGGSAGPEDPSVQLGGVAGSAIGRIFRLSEKRTRTLVASGVAGAVAAAFNAPIAGVFFALEVVVGELSAALFPPVVLAAVAAAAISRWLNGNHPAFQVPTYDLGSALVELPFYAVLGALTALIGVLFVRLLFSIEDIAAKMRLTRVVRGISIGLLIGLVGLWLPEVIGVGYGTVGTILLGQTTGAGHLALFLGVKLLLTAICIAVIGVGGTFAPSLYLGAMVGAIVGILAHMLFPGTPAAAYALVGMGGVLTSVVRAPITAVLLIFEITNDYRIILPIMLCVAVSNLVSTYLFKESVYTERLARHGIRLRSGRDVNVLESVLVQEAMTTRFETIEPTRSIRETLDRMTTNRYHGLVVADHGELIGIVTTSDIGRALESGVDAESAVGDIATRDLLTAYTDQTLHEAITLFAARDIRQVPVVRRESPRTLVGMLRRSDIVRSYSAGVVRRTEQRQQTNRERLTGAGELEMIEITLDSDSALIGQMVHQLELPADCVLTTVYIGSEPMVPRQNMILQPGMRLTFLASRSGIEALESIGRGSTVDADDSPRYHRLRIEPSMAAAGRAVRDLGLPEGVLLVAIDRNGTTIVPHGTSVIEPDDVITLLATAEEYRMTIERLAGVENA